jgi:hypothetical protein
MFLGRPLKWIETGCLVISAAFVLSACQLQVTSTLPPEAPHDDFGGDDDDDFSDVALNGTVMPTVRSGREIFQSMYSLIVPHLDPIVTTTRYHNTDITLAFTHRMLESEFPPIQSGTPATNAIQELTPSQINTWTNLAATFCYHLSEVDTDPPGVPLPVCAEGCVDNPNAVQNTNNGILLRKVRTVFFRGTRWGSRIVEASPGVAGTLSQNVIQSFGTPEKRLEFVDILIDRFWTHVPLNLVEDERQRIADLIYEVLQAQGGFMGDGSTITNFSTNTEVNLINVRLGMAAACTAALAYGALMIQ